MKFFLVFLLPIVYCLFPAIISASGDFYTSININYSIDDRGLASVTEKISLTNLVSRVYPTKYDLIFSTPPVNLTGHDFLGPLIITTSPHGPDGTLASIAFNSQSAGKGKSTDFTLNYQLQLAKKNGEVWQVTLPKISNPDLVDKYQVTLEAPVSFGSVINIDPPPDQIDGQQYSFSSKHTKDYPITAVFGAVQPYLFRLGYNLENSGKSKKTQYLYLPPDTYYQKIYLDRPEPFPQAVTVDKYGNWLARYDLPPNTKFSVIVSGYAHIRSQPIKFTATPALSDLQIYVTQNNKASINDIYFQAQRQPPGQFAKSFAKSASLAGIPARIITGIDPELTSWSEYWDENAKSWKAVSATHSPSDPKFPSNHLAINLLPTNSTDSNVFPTVFSIEPASHAPLPGQPLQISWTPPAQIFPWPSTARIRVTNNQPQAIYQNPLSVRSRLVNVTSPSSLSVPVLPPYGSIEHKISLVSPFWPSLVSSSLSVEVGSSNVAYNIPVQHFVAWYAIFSLITAASVITLVWLAHWAWGLSVQKRLR